MTSADIIPFIRYADANAAIEILEKAFGFEPAVSMGIYCVVDDADAHYERAKAAGAEITMAPIDEDYGGRDYSVRDLEGNAWSFGTYRPE